MVLLQPHKMIPPTLRNFVFMVTFVRPASGKHCPRIPVLGGSAEQLRRTRPRAAPAQTHKARTKAANISKQMCQPPPSHDISEHTA